ncbi:LysR family transcriptional regulator [Mesorhizobium sp. M1406]|uniref:LysR family transcriptional regulator n=1 Tax=Mesorhizobium sp. M1406 TaxID=2957099 RepID=UPI0033392DDD
MDLLNSMRLFVRIVERGSFSSAAGDIGIPRATATNTIKALERRLGVSLLQRTTRHVAPTMDGDAYYHRCRALIRDLEAMEDEFAASPPKGHLRIDVHGNLFRQLLLPRFSEFTARYPELTLHIGDGDRLVDLVREGVDCVVRAGELDDSGMVVRRLALLEEVTVASPDYLAKHGTPACLEDLHSQGHRMIGFVSSRTGIVLPLEFTDNGSVHHVTLSSPLTVNSSDTSAALARAGFGLVQAPRFRFEEELASGSLIDILPNNPPTPTPLSVLYPGQRHVSRRLRIFINWLVDVFGDLQSEPRFLSPSSDKGR